MSYIDPPEPTDATVIVPETSDHPAFTWGDHRRLVKMLEAMDGSEDAIAAAKANLEKSLEEAGYVKPERICEYCHRKESEDHEIECRDSNDPSLWARREAGGYRYLDENFHHVHTTSVPLSDEEALEYFKIVQLMYPADPDYKVKYIMRREINGSEYHMMPFYFDKEKWEVFPIEQPGS